MGHISLLLFSFPEMLWRFHWREKKKKKSLIALFRLLKCLWSLTFHCHLFRTDLLTPLLDWDQLSGPSSSLFLSLWCHPAYRRRKGIVLLPSLRFILTDILETNRIFYRTLCQNTIPINERSLSKMNAWRQTVNNMDMWRGAVRKNRSRMPVCCSGTSDPVNRVGRLGRRGSKDRDLCKERQRLMSANEVGFDNEEWGVYWRLFKVRPHSVYGEMGPEEC